MKTHSGCAEPFSAVPPTFRAALFDPLAGLLYREGLLGALRSCQTPSPPRALPSAVSFVSLPFLFNCTCPPWPLGVRSDASSPSWATVATWLTPTFTLPLTALVMICKCLGDRDGILFLRGCLVPCSPWEMPAMSGERICPSPRPVGRGAHLSSPPCREGGWEDGS